MTYRNVICLECREPLDGEVPATEFYPGVGQHGEWLSKHSDHRFRAEGEGKSHFLGFYYEATK